MVREHFKEDGTPKVSYFSESHALRALAFSFWDQEPYECSFCGNWHNGAIRKEDNHG